MYRKHPELYAYNIASKRHVLKSSVSYLRGMEKDPDNFMDSAEVLRGEWEPPKDEVEPPQIQNMPRAALPIPPPHFDQAAEQQPKSKSVIKQAVKQEEPDLKEMVAEMVRAEVRQNRAAYENKGVEDMEVLFRQMLIRKLGGSGAAAGPKQPPINKLAAPVKKQVVAAKSKKAAFVVKPAQVSDEDEYEDEEEDEDE